MSEESCFVRGESKPRVLSEQCATCIGRPGNLMGLRPGRVREMVRDALQQGRQGIICHETCSYGIHPEAGGALCNWFYDTYGHQSNFIRIMERLGGFTEITLTKGEEIRDDGPGVEGQAGAYDQAEVIAKMIEENQPITGGNDEART